jgi:hypothetical protein
MKREKPTWMTDKEWFVKEFALSMNIPEQLVDKIVKHQFEEFVNATRTRDTLELSGFGKFRFKRPGAQKVIEKLERQIALFRDKMANNPTSKMVDVWNDGIDNMLIKRQMLINRLNKNETIDADLRGMEKPSAPRSHAKTDDR